MSHYAFGTQDKITAMLCQRVAWIASTAKNHIKRIAEDCHQDCHCRSYKGFTNEGNLIQPLSLTFVGRKPERNLHAYALPNRDRD